MNTAKTNKEILDALISYCDYQERCSFEVRTRLNKYALSDEDKECIIEDLKEFKYLDDTRFAETFVRGKHSLKGWGKNKIKAALYQKRISSSIIDLALNTILIEEGYKNKLATLFEKKWDLLGNKTDLKTKQKLFRFLYSKGYEASLINSLMMERFKA